MAEILSPPPVPMELPVEELEAIRNTYYFKNQICENKTLAIWKLPRFSEQWQIQLNKYSNENAPRLPVNFGTTEDAGSSTVVKFTFNLTWHAERELPSHGLCFYFRPTEIPPSINQIEGKYRLEILKSNGEVFKACDSQVHDWNPNVVLNRDDDGFLVHELESYYYQEFYSMDTIINNRDILGEEDTLRVRLTFTRMAVRATEDPNPVQLQELVAKNTDRILCGDMEALLNDPSDADVQIKTKDGVLLKVHKLILKRRVPMFRALFQTDMIEKSRGMVETPEISSGAMKILLHYIYTGKLHPTWKQWRALLAEVISGAKQYELSGLVQYYDHLLVTLCNDIDVDDLMQVAKLYGLKEAEQAIEKWQRDTAVTINT